MNIEDLKDKNCYTENGEAILNWFHIDKMGSYRIKIENIMVHSERRQALALFFTDFHGKILLNGNSLKIPKGIFQHYLFKQGEEFKNGMLLEVTANSGGIVFATASNEKATPDFFHSGAMGREFWVEILAEGRFRFYCNDNWDSKTYDHMIFDMEITDTSSL